MGSRKAGARGLRQLKGGRMFRGAAYSGYDKRVYELVPEGARVLDVGCAGGDLARALIKGKGCQVVGIEKDPSATRRARRACEVVVVDVEREIPRLPRKGFDVMVFSDVLEHLREPDLVLQRFRNFLADDGYLIAAIPNIAFISVRLSLLLGRFNYTDIGVLDRTHLRFFTLDTAKRLIEASGYRVVDIHSYVPHQRKYFLLGIAGNVWKRLFSMKFVFRARKA